MHDCIPTHVSVGLLLTLDTFRFILSSLLVLPSVLPHPGPCCSRFFVHLSTLKSSYEVWGRGNARSFPYGPGQRPAALLIVFGVLYVLNFTINIEPNKNNCEKKAGEDASHGSHRVVAPM